MSSNDLRGPRVPSDAVGIIVQSGHLLLQPPRTVAFVWGREISPAPSLPFGRWKAGVRSAA